MEPVKTLSSHHPYFLLHAILNARALKQHNRAIVHVHAPVIFNKIIKIKRLPVPILHKFFFENFLSHSLRNLNGEKERRTEREDS